MRFRRLIITLAGVLAGLAVGWVVAVNLNMTIGVDMGYQATLREVFDHSTLAGVATVGLLVGGPAIVGYLAFRYWGRDSSVDRHDTLV